MKKIYATRYYPNENDPPVVLCFFETREDAECVDVSRLGYKVEAKEYWLYHSYEEYQADNDPVVKKKALSKLTDDELRVLGLRRE